MSPRVALLLFVWTSLRAEGEDPAALLSRLASPSWAEREEAAERLVALGPAAVPVLVDALASSDPEVVYRAQEILDRLGWLDPRLEAEVLDAARRLLGADAAGRGAILESLSGTDARIWRPLADLLLREATAAPPTPGADAEAFRARHDGRMALAELLIARLPQPAPPAALDALYAVRAVWGSEVAGKALADLPPDARAAMILRAASSAAPAVRSGAVREMCEAPGDVFSEALGAAMADPDPSVARPAIRWCIGRGRAGGIDALRAHLTLPCASDTGAALHESLPDRLCAEDWSAVRALPGTGSPVARLHLLARLPDAPWPGDLRSEVLGALRDGDAAVRARAQEAFVRAHALDLEVVLSEPSWGEAYAGAAAAWLGAGEGVAAFADRLAAVGFPALRIEEVVREDRQVLVRGGTSLPDGAVLTVLLYTLSDGSDRPRYEDQRRVRTAGGRYEVRVRAPEGRDAMRVEVQFREPQAPGLVVPGIAAPTHAVRVVPAGDGPR